jgi:WD40 repeat protein
MEGHKNEIPSVAFSPDAQRLASPSVHGTVKVWDVASGQELRTVNLHPGLMSVAFYRDSQRLASPGLGRYGESLGRGHWPGVAHGPARFRSVRFSPDGQPTEWKRAAGEE